MTDNLVVAPLFAPCYSSEDNGNEFFFNYWQTLWIGVPWYLEPITLVPHPTPPRTWSIRCYVPLWKVWRWGQEENAIPFLMNALHHARSAGNPAFRRMGIGLCGGRRTEWSRSNMRLRKVLAALITLQAWLRCPMTDSSSLRVQCARIPHSSSMLANRSSLSAGRRSSPASVSTSIPKNVRQVVGPSLLWSAIGTPRWPRSVFRICTKW